MGEGPPNRAKTSFRCNPANLSASSRSSDVLPCARRESVHMGACQPVLADARESRNHAENCTRPSEAPPLPCATFPKSPFTPRQRDRSSCSAGLLNRFRCGTEPISRRNTTDLGEVARHCLGSQLARSRLTTPAGHPGRHRDRADGLPPGAAAGFCGRCRPRSRSATRPRPPPGGRER